MSQVNISPLATNPLLGKMFDNAGLKQEAPKKTWEELDSIYWTIAESIMNMGENVNGVIRHLNAQHVDNIDEVILTVDGLRRDLEDITQTLVTIRTRYEGKTGVIVDEAENNLCLDCFTDYQALAERQRSMILQPLMTLTEVLAEVDLKNKQQKVEFTAAGDIVGEAVVVKE